MAGPWEQYDPSKPPWVRFAEQAATTQLKGEEAIAAAKRPELIGTGGLSATDVPSASSPLRIMAGYLLSATPQQLEGIVTKALPGASIKHDSDNNPIVMFNGKEYFINKPGFSEADVMSLSGLIIGFGKVGKAISEIPSAMGRVVAGATGGAATSAAMDVGAAALGAETGIDVPRAAATGVGMAAMAPISRFSTRAPLTTAQTRTASQESYRAAERAGLVVDPARIPLNNWTAAAERAGLDIPAAGARNPSNTPQASRLLERIGEEVAAGPLTLQRMETLRKLAVGIREAGRTETGLSNDAAVANALIHQMDNFINGLTPADLVAGGGNARAATAALREARRLWNLQAKSHTIEILRERADLAAPTKGWDQALREAFRPLARDITEMSRFTAQEQQAIRAIVRGGTIATALRLLGRIGPEGGAAIGGALGLATGGGPGVIAGGVSGGAVAAVSRETLRPMAGRLAQSRAAELNNIILGGQVIPVPWLPVVGAGRARDNILPTPAMP